MAIPVVDNVAADMAPPFSSVELTLPDPEVLEPEGLFALPPPLEEVLVPFPIGSATYETPLSLAVYSAKGGTFAFVSQADLGRIAEALVEQTAKGLRVHKADSPKTLPSPTS